MELTGDSTSGVVVVTGTVEVSLLVTAMSVVGASMVGRIRPGGTMVNNVGTKEGVVFLRNIPIGGEMGLGADEARVGGITGAAVNDGTVIGVQVALR